MNPTLQILASVISKFRVYQKVKSDLENKKVEGRSGGPRTPGRGAAMLVRRLGKAMRTWQLSAGWNER